MIGHLRSGTLGRFGYKNIKRMKASTRHRILNKAVKKLGATPVFRKLNAVAILQRGDSMRKSNLFKADRNYVKRKFMS